MQTRTVEKRVETLELQVNRLNELPDQMASLSAQVASLGTQVASLDTRVASLETQFVHFRGEVRDEFSAVRSLILDAKTHASVLYEDLVAKISLIGEHRAARRVGSSHQKRKKR